MYDVLVIGAGLAGLTAAAAAAAAGAETAIVAEGEGALTLSSGCLDVWGLSDEPLTAVKELSRAAVLHPYALAVDVLEEAINFFAEICRQEGYPLTGQGKQNQKVLTVLGNLRRTFLVPPSMVLPPPASVTRVVAVGSGSDFQFNPRLFCEQLAARKVFPAAECRAVEVEPVGSSDYDSFCRHLLPALQTQVGPGTLVVLSPLDDKPDLKYWRLLRRELQVEVVEVVGPPPSLPGRRLALVLRNFLLRHKVQLRCNLRVVGYEEEGGRIKAVVVQNKSGIKRALPAQAFVLATGSFWGRGLVAQHGGVRETIFQLPVYQPEELARENLLHPEGQPLIEAGVEVDNSLRSPGGWKNLFVAGSILAHANFARERSGMGVAVVTGYKAGRLAALTALGCRGEESK